MFKFCVLPTNVKINNNNKVNMALHAQQMDQMSNIDYIDSMSHLSAPIKPALFQNYSEDDSYFMNQLENADEIDFVQQNNYYESIEEEENEHQFGDFDAEL